MPVTARRQAVLFVVVASIAFATSASFARWARPADPLVVAFGRVLVAAAILVAWDARGVLGAWRGAPTRQRRGIVGAGVLLAIHFALFLVGLDRTSLPAAVALVSLEPLSVVLCAWALHGLRPTGMELGGVLLATAGAAIVSSGAGSGEHHLAGDVLVVLAVLVYGLYVSAARAFRGTIGPRPYAALVYAAAACALAATAEYSLARAPSGLSGALPPHALLAIVALAIVPTIVGHTAVQAAARDMSPSTVALVSPGETVGGLALGAWMLAATPSRTELVGAAVVLVGATTAILGARRPPTPAAG